MERPKLTEEQIHADNEKLTELRDVAIERYGSEVQFGYFSGEGKFYVMSFDEAIQACGHYIAKVSIEEALVTLDSLRENFQNVASTSAGESLRLKGEENAKQKLAELAISTD